MGEQRVTRGQLAPCGTEAAYQRHRRLGEPVDEACQKATNDYHAQLRERPEYRAYFRGTAAARARAARRVRDNHRAEYLRILQEEMAKVPGVRAQRES